MRSFGYDCRGSWEGSCDDDDHRGQLLHVGRPPDHGRENAKGKSDTFIKTEADAKGSDIF